MAESHRRLILSTLSVPGDMLEWGGGGTTRWFLDHLTARQRLTTVEHDGFWMAELRLACGGAANWCPRLIPGKHVGDNAQPGEESPSGLADYINPEPLAMYDVFLIDGVARGACLANVAAHGKRGAVVFLHDGPPQRRWYDWAIAAFADRFVEPQIVPPQNGEYPAHLWMARLG